VHSESEQGCDEYICVWLDNGDRIMIGGSLPYHVSLRRKREEGRRGGE